MRIGDENAVCEIWRFRGPGGVCITGQQMAPCTPTTQSKWGGGGNSGHARSFWGSYHDEERILTSVIASVSEGANDMEVMGVEVGNGDGGSGGCSEGA